MFSRIRDPVFSGHGYSPAITKVLIDVSQAGARSDRRVAPVRVVARWNPLMLVPEPETIRLVGSRRRVGRQRQGALG